MYSQSTSRKNERASLDQVESQLATLKIKNELRGDLAETFFKHYSEQGNFAYARPESIGAELIHRNVITFRIGFKRFQIKVPNAPGDFLLEIVRPSNRLSSSPSYSFDFLTCPIRQDELNLVDKILSKTTKYFTIVEIKSGGSEYTTNQQGLMRKCSGKGIRYAAYRISNVDDAPKQWDLKKEI